MRDENVKIILIYKTCEYKICFTEYQLDFTK